MADKMPKNRFLAAMLGIGISIAGLTAIAWLNWTIFGLIVTIFGAVIFIAAAEGERL